jgi:site-specific DNA recombinase
VTDLTTKKIRVALYLRVSSDEQREHQTIKTQEDIILRWLEQNEDRVDVAGWFKDDGISGTIPLDGREHGKDLIGLCSAGLVDRIVVTRMDRLGRTSLELLQIRERLERLHVSIFAILENVEDPFEYELRAAFAAEERRRLLKRSKEGMDRAAREGRYCGGIVPLGFMVEGKKPFAKLTPSDAPIYRDWSESDLVRQIYTWLAMEGWSCVRIANHLNGLGVPTSYMKDGRLVRRKRGLRAERTQGRWRAGRIRNLVVNPVYKGEYHYGRRTEKERDIIVAEVPALVSRETWDAAQTQLKSNRLMTKNLGRVYLLRSLARCSICSLTFVGTPGQNGAVWYRCNGQIVGRGPIEGRCPSRAFRADWIEPLVVRDITGWLLNPGEVVEQLRDEERETSAKATREAERLMLEAALSSIPRQRDRLLEALRHELVTLEDLGGQFDAIAREEASLRERMGEVDDTPDDSDVPLDMDLLEAIRLRVEAGLDPKMWREVLSLLVKRIEVKTEVMGPRSKRLTLTIHYRFPGVVDVDSGRDSSRR